MLHRPVIVGQARGWRKRAAVAGLLLPVVIFHRCSWSLELFCIARRVSPEGKEVVEVAEASNNKEIKVGLIHDAVGEYMLPRPWFFSPKNQAGLWEELGVNVRILEDDADGPVRHMVAPQPPSGYRSPGEVEEMYIRDMNGEAVDASRNPGIRLELDFVNAEEESDLAEELRDLAKSFGYNFTLESEDNPEESWRITGRAECQGGGLIAPWGWGVDFNHDKMPPTLAKVASRIAAHPGYQLGPLRDVTVNIRQSVDYQMSPHIDPLPDGPNSFVLSLLSGAVVTFSPVASLREDAERANDDEEYFTRSYTDDDLDCLVPRRAMYQFSGEARYLWTHAVRPPAVEETESGVEAFDWWGTHEKVMRRQKDRAAIIFTFADPVAPVSPAPVSTPLRAASPTPKRERSSSVQQQPAPTARPIAQPVVRPAAKVVGTPAAGPVATSPGKRRPPPGPPV